MDLASHGLWEWLGANLEQHSPTLREESRLCASVEVFEFQFSGLRGRSSSPWLQRAQETRAFGCFERSSGAVRARVEMEAGGGGQEEEEQDNPE